MRRTKQAMSPHAITLHKPRCGKRRKISYNAADDDTDKDSDAVYRNKSVMDNLMTRLENYSSQLERVVAERSADLAEEQLKTESLLYKMLPRWAAVVIATPVSGLRAAGHGRLVADDIGRKRQSGFVCTMVGILLK